MLQDTLGHGIGSPKSLMSAIDNKHHGPSLQFLLSSAINKDISMSMNETTIAHSAFDVTDNVYRSAFWDSSSKCIFSKG